MEITRFSIVLSLSIPVAVAEVCDRYFFNLPTYIEYTNVMAAATVVVIVLYSVVSLWLEKPEKEPLSRPVQLKVNLHKAKNEYALAVLAVDANGLGITTFDEHADVSFAREAYLACNAEMEEYKASVSAGEDGQVTKKMKEVARNYNFYRGVYSCSAGAKEARKNYNNADSALVLQLNGKEH